MATKREVLEVAGREVAVSNPDKIYFPRAGYRKLDLVRYYLAVAEGALRGGAGRPLILKRFPGGVEAEPVYQKRAPQHRPPWIETATFRFPSGRHAEEVVVRDAAQLVWVVNLGCIDLNPHPVRADDMDHPDELRIDLDPVPGVAWPQIVEVALLVREALDEVGLVGWPKTSGSRGIHVLCRIRREWPFAQVRRAALALAREVEARAPGRATSKWWKEERHGVFLDYNQNARDRTTASAYSVRPTADARVSTPLPWDELTGSDPAAFTLATVPARFAERGDPHAGIDDAAGGIEGLLAWAEAQEGAGLPDAPWPPHFEKQAGEAPRVAPSRARRTRRSRLPVVVVGQAKARAEVLAGLERWRARHPEVAARLAPEHTLVDTMRGRHTAWYRVRINLEAIPEDQRPAAEPLDPDYDPAGGWAGLAPEPDGGEWGDGDGAGAPGGDREGGDGDGGAGDR